MPGRTQFTGLIRLFRETFSDWNRHNAPQLGAALAYYSTLSLAPLLVIAVAVAGLVLGPDAVRGNIRWQMQDLVGSRGAEIIQTALQNAYKPATGVLATCLGVVTLFFGASGVFNELRTSLNWIWEAPQKPGSGLLTMVKQQFFSFAMVLSIGFLLLVSLLLSAALAAIGKLFAGFLPLPEPVLHLLSLLVSFVTITGLFALIYKFVPDVKLQWRDVWIGAAVTSLLFSIGKFLIGLYLGKAGVGSAYGAAGSLVIVLVWIYYSSQIFYFGAEFTRIYARQHGSRTTDQAIPAWRRPPERPGAKTPETVGERR